MIISEIVTLLFYVISIAFLPAYFGTSYLKKWDHVLTLLLSDLTFVVSVRFVWKVAVIVAVSALPLYIIKMIRRKVAPAASSKLL